MSCRRILVYLSGPYTAGTHEGIAANIHTARTWACSVWRAGFACLAPHLNTAHFELCCPGVGYNDYIEGDLRMLESCDAVLMLPLWEDSMGAIAERRHALEIGVPVFHDLTGLVAGFKESL